MPARVHSASQRASAAADSKCFGSVAGSMTRMRVSRDEIAKGSTRARLPTARRPRYTSTMRIRTLGRSGLRVSELCLGAMTFGMPQWGCDEDESLRIIDRFLDAGGNF